MQKRPFLNRWRRSTTLFHKGSSVADFRRSPGDSPTVSSRGRNGHLRTGMLLTFAVTVALVADSAVPQERSPVIAQKPPVAAAPKTVSSSTSPALNKPAPKGTADLVSLEKQVRKVVDRLIAATVAVQLGATQGSGVIVTRDGYVLTAAHVAGAPGRDVSLVLSDGRMVEARSLGLNAKTDAGLLKITDEGDYPFVSISDTKDLSVGDWCLALGHPGGYETGRPPVVRMGRLVSKRESVLQTDCTLVGGDSGGPLFDLAGNVIGIHSRIGAPTTLNLHVPVNTYIESWERFARSEKIDSTNQRQRALLGIDGRDDPQGARVSNVFPKWPAETAGLQPGDIVTQVDGKDVQSFEGLRQELAGKQPGDTVKIVFLRGEQTLERAAILVGFP